MKNKWISLLLSMTLTLSLASSISMPAYAEEVPESAETAVSESEEASDETINEAIAEVEVPESPAVEEAAVEESAVEEPSAEVIATDQDQLTGIYVHIDSTNFPDQKLRDIITAMDDSMWGNDDEYLSDVESQRITELDLSGSNITTLKGIEYLPYITVLNCSDNKLTSLDLTNHSSLRELWCVNNRLTSINLTGCTSLKTINCTQNRLTGLNLSGCPGLEGLYCNDNPAITSLDIHNCNNIKFVECYGYGETRGKLSSINAAGCTNLYYLLCYYNQLTSINVTGCTSLAQLNCSDNQLAALNVSSCTKLEELYCDQNNLKALNLSLQTLLKKLRCDYNQLTALDVSKSTALEELSCDFNKLTSLNVSGCTKLKNISCQENELSKLDVSKCTALLYLLCSSNKLTSLDVSKCSHLEALSCEVNSLRNLNLRNNPELKRLSCQSNQLASLDLTKQTKLTDYSTWQTFDITGKSLDVSFSQGFDPGKVTGLSNLTLSGTRFTAKPDSSGGYYPGSYIYKCGNGKTMEVCVNYDYSEIPSSTGFIDVEDGKYYTDAVKWAVDRGVTTGTSPITFSPNDPCIRAQVVTFLWRAYGCPEPSSAASPFGDVQDSSKYYYKAIIWAAENGITTGTSPTTFSPNDTVTRGQFVTFLYRAQGSPDINGSCPFTDVSSSKFYYRPVIWAASTGVTTGTSPTTFSPEDPCIRAQVVTFIYRALK